MSSNWARIARELEGDCDCDCDELRDERDRLDGLLRALREQLEEAQLRSIEARNPGIDMDEVRASRAAAADRGVTDGDRNEGDEE